MRKTTDILAEKGAYLAGMIAMKKEVLKALGAKRPVRGKIENAMNIFIGKITSGEEGK